ncbi:hypothetical protein F0562_030335 [Nyssa sinensis]|uniref:TF-B3 domain-containing protein n=1 Tax=Nyssa sinensis TaxID=561372 RepID=A0A5J5B094_9ASTE|nr:hypothetical protein F0562_030335 [Nyssa sinensis]
MLGQKKEECFKKTLTKSDIDAALEITRGAANLPPGDEEMRVFDQNERVWRFKVGTRKGGRRFMKNQWLRFVEEADLNIGTVKIYTKHMEVINNVINLKLKDDVYPVKLTNETNCHPKDRSDGRASVEELVHEANTTLDVAEDDILAGADGVVIEDERKEKSKEDGEIDPQLGLQTIAKSPQIQANLNGPEIPGCGELGPLICNLEGAQLCASGKQFNTHGQQQPQAYT